MNEANLTDQGAYATITHAYKCKSFKCEDETDCDEECCMVYKTQDYFKFKVRKLYPYPTVGDEFNEERDEGFQNFPPGYNHEAPTPSTVIPEPPEGLGSEEMADWFDDHEDSYLESDSVELNWSPDKCIKDKEWEKVPSGL